jgi:hypothetical protein
VSVSLAVNETPKTVTISSPGNLNPNSVPIPLDITFSNTITGFDASDILIENAIISSFTKIDSKNYKVEVIPFS